MKALSFKQPWAELILNGKKKIELRKWNTKFRGEFFIHSSKIPDYKSMKKFGFGDLPCGFILGKAVLTEVKKYKGKNEFNKDRNKHLGDEEWGCYGFALKNVRRVNPVPTKGQLNFWEYK